MLNRRGFLALSATAALKAALPSSLQAQQNGGDVLSAANMGAYRQGLLTEARFSKLVGTSFRVFLKDGTVTSMRLRDVKARKPQMLTASQTQEIVAKTQGVYSITRRLSSFTAVFALEGKPFPQDTYVVDSTMIGRFSVLLVQGAPGTCHATFTTIDGGEAS